MGTCLYGYSVHRNVGVRKSIHPRLHRPFSKYIVAIPIADKSKETVAKAFVKNVILIFGCPDHIHSDQGKEFLNETLNEISSILNIKKTATAGYDPQGNGLAERANQTLLNILKKSTASNWSWDERLPFAAYAYNTTPSEVTGYSPFHLLFGRMANFPGEYEIRMGGNPFYTMDEDTYLQLFKENLQIIHNSARENSKIARLDTKKRYDERPNVTAHKFAEGDKCMVIYPGANAKSIHKKLCWNKFGPYKIIKVEKSSASVVPIDKLSANPITVPLERLVRVPDPVPNISTLPHGRNPYRNVLFSVKVEKVSPREGKVNGELSWVGNHGKSEEQMSKNQLGTIDPSVEEVVATVCSSAIKTLQWTGQCTGKEHEFCGKMYCAELDAILDLQSEPGNLVVNTPLQALIALFVLQSGAAVSSTVGKDIAKLVLGADPGQELVLYEGVRKDKIRAGAFPGDADIERIWTLWAEKCTVARGLLQGSGFEKIEVEKNEGTGRTNFRSVKVSAPEVVKKLPDTERGGWTELFNKSGWILEKVRAGVIHRCPVFIEQPRVVVGDSSAFLLYGQMKDQTQFVGTERGNLSLVIRALSDCALSSKVLTMIVLVGRDCLVGDETVDQIVEQCRRIQQLCRRHPSVKILWLPPPYVREKDAAYTELIGRLSALLGKWFICVTPTGRSLVELWRYGDSFDRSRVGADGWMTHNGVKALAAWVKSQVPEWPGDRELGIRAVRSSVATVRESGLCDRSELSARLRQGSGLGDRPVPPSSNRTGSGLGDRLEFRSSERAHPYRQIRRFDSRNWAGRAPRR